MPTITHPKDFNAERAWGALDIATFDNTSVRLHWTDQPYIWHVNDGQEVFVVVDGVVDMFYREAGAEHCVRLHTGDIFHAELGCEHGTSCGRGAHFGGGNRGQCVSLWL